MTIWKPGMRCVCVDDCPSTYQIPGRSYAGGLDGLKASHVYTVTDVVNSDFDGALQLVIAEIVRVRAPDFEWFHRGFRASRFRPLSETRLDQFRQHLAPVDRERADA